MSGRKLTELIWARILILTPVRVDSKAAAAARVANLETVLQRVCAISGAPGISIGVSYNGEPIYRFNHGVRDVEASLPINGDTVFPIGTLAKTFTASAVGMLVDQGFLKWHTPIRDILPAFHSTSTTVEENLNIVDLLSQRSGLARSNYWWQGSDGQLLLQKKDLLPFYSKLPETGSFRADWGYSNWGYAVVGAVIEKLSGMTYSEYMAKNVLEPLQLTNTTFKAVDAASIPNLANPYAALDDASPFLLPQPPVSDETIMGPAMGGASSANDLLQYSMALLESYRYESGALTKGGETTPILKNGLMHLAGHIFTAKTTLEKSYAFGFYRSQLPATILGMGWNSLYVAEMPKLIPRGHLGPVVAHGGSLPGYHSSIALLPEIGASIVVCTNSIALGDVSGWASLGIIEALIDTPRPSDFVALATEAAGNNVNNVDKLWKQLKEAKKSKKEQRRLDEYVGKYLEEAHNWVIEIRKKDDECLEVLFQGLESQKWALTHYEGDTFLWLASREEQAKRCRMTTYPLVANHFKLIFQANKEGEVDRVCWPHEAGVPVDLQRFMKK
ncbi:MAG: hypothetical protein Q9201_002595 [Fulgogasparrea decipioides]